MKQVIVRLFDMLWLLLNEFMTLTVRVCRSFCIGHTNFRVLHVSNFSHKPYILTRKLREKGVKADYLALNLSWSYLNMGDDAYDFALHPAEEGIIRYYLKQFYLLWFVMSRYDIVHVHCRSSFTMAMKEYLYLKRIGVKLVFHFRGCDARSKSLNNVLHPELNCCQECDYPQGACDNSFQRDYLSLVANIGDAFFATTPDLLDFCPEGTVWLPFVLPPEELIESIVKEEADTSIFTVVTSSNHDGVDGTGYVRDAVRRLQDEGVALKLVEVRQVPYKKALGIYASADLYVGKLRMGYYNNANIESMLLSVPCISYIRPDLRESYCPACPVIQATPETLFDVLKQTMAIRKELPAIGRKGLEFVLNKHADKKVLQVLIDKYQLLVNKSVTRGYEGIGGAG